MAIKKGGKLLTAREQKAYVQELTGWSTSTYQKEYDKLRNRVRAFERATGETKKINVADLLARHERGKYFARREGKAYSGTELYNAIQAAPTISTGKKLSQRQIEKISTAAREGVNRAYKGFLENSVYGGKAFERLVARTEKRRGGALTVAEYSALLRAQAERSTAARNVAKAQALQLRIKAKRKDKEEVPEWDIKQIDT